MPGALKARALLLAGVAFDFGGGQVYTVPPLSVGALELLQQRLSAMPAMAITDPQAVATIIDAAHAALLRNYPETTRAQVADLVDLGNMGDVYECLMDVGGIKRRAQQAQQEAAAGNTPPPATLGTAGPASTPASPPTPAGPSSTSEST